VPAESRIAIASDHAGFTLKEEIAAELRREGFRVLDLGTYTTEPVDYPDYARAIGKAIQEEEAERGILVCGSGVGASVAANKMKGARAGLCHDTCSALQRVEHDDMDALRLGRGLSAPSSRESCSPPLSLVSAARSAMCAGWVR
jgi:RpiB/LacA/LacB family sugar-phosphate isomerase